MHTKLFHAYFLIIGIAFYSPITWSTDSFGLNRDVAQLIDKNIPETDRFKLLKSLLLNVKNVTQATINPYSDTTFPEYYFKKIPTIDIKPDNKFITLFFQKGFTFINTYKQSEQFLAKYLHSYDHLGINIANVFTHVFTLDRKPELFYKNRLDLAKICIHTKFETDLPTHNNLPALLTTIFWVFKVLNKTQGFPFTPKPLQKHIAHLAFVNPEVTKEIVNATTDFHVSLKRKKSLTTFNQQLAECTDRKFLDPQEWEKSSLIMRCILCNNIQALMRINAILNAPGKEQLVVYKH